MASLNKVLLMGNLTRNPEVRYTPGGSAVCEFGLAVNRRFTQANGQEKDETCFVDVTVWGKQAESTSRYIQKGSSVFVEGRLVYDQWEDRETQKKRSRLRVSAERVQFLDRRDASSQNAGGEPMPEGAQQPGGYSRYRGQGGQGYSQGNSYGQQGNYAPQQQYAPRPQAPAPQQSAPAVQDASAPVEDVPYEPVEGIDDDIPF